MKKPSKNNLLIILGILLTSIVISLTTPLFILYFFVFNKSENSLDVYTTNSNKTISKNDVFKSTIGFSLNNEQIKKDVENGKFTANIDGMSCVFIHFENNFKVKDLSINKILSLYEKNVLKVIVDTELHTETINFKGKLAVVYKKFDQGWVFGKVQSLDNEYFEPIINIEIAPNTEQIKNDYLFSKNIQSIVVKKITPDYKALKNNSKSIQFILSISLTYYNQGITETRDDLLTYSVLQKNNGTLEYYREEGINKR